MAQVNAVLELLSFLPNFPVSKQDILKITPSFAISFYHRYLNQLQSNCKSLLSYNFDDDVLNYCPLNINHDMFLFLLIRHILNKIGISYFNICDFYRPSGRTKTTIKICMNFLLYFQENLPLCKEIVDSFNEKIEKNDKRRDRKLAKKNELSEITSKNGLLLVGLEELEKELHQELQIFESFSTSNYLDDEIEQLQKDLETISRRVRLEEQEIKDLNDEFKILSDQVVDESEYGIYKDRTKRFEIEINHNEMLIDENTKLLESKEKQLEHFVECRLILEKLDLSALDYIEKIKYSKQEIAELESNNYEEIINKKKYTLDVKRQNINEMDKKFEEESCKLKQLLLEVNKEVDNISEEFCSEKISQHHLIVDYRNLRQVLVENQNQYKNLESEQDYLEESNNRLYAKLLGSLNLITTNFYDNLKKYNCNKY